MPDETDFLKNIPSGFTVLHTEDGSGPSCRQEYCQIVLFQTNGDSYQVEGKTYHPLAGDLILTTDRELRAEPQYGRERYVAYLDAAFFDSVQRLAPAGEDLSRCFFLLSESRSHLLRLDEEEKSHITRIFESLAEAPGPRAFGGETLRQCYMVELLVRLNRASLQAPPEGGAEYNRRLEQVVGFINQNLGENLSLELLSLRFSISKYHLTREFKRYFGLPVHQYIMKKRLLAARAGLRRGEAVAAVFRESGFGDYSHFSRAFREAFGASPREYRNLMMASRVFPPENK